MSQEEEEEVMAEEEEEEDEEEAAEEAEEEADMVAKMETNTLMKRERIEERLTRIMLATRDGMEKLLMVDSLTSKVELAGEDITTETKTDMEEEVGETKILRRESPRTREQTKLFRMLKRQRQLRRKRKLQPLLRRSQRWKSLLRKRSTTRPMQS